MSEVLVPFTDTRCTVGQHLVAKRKIEVSKVTELYWIWPE